MDENQLYGATLDRVYRLALVVSGAPRRAVSLTRRSYLSRDPADSEPEPALARGLLAAPAPFWPWRPDPALAHYSGLAPAELEQLRRAFAAATPEARLALAAPAIAGIELTNAAPAQTIAPGAPWPRRAGDRHALLALLARAWGLLPAEATYADVYDQALLAADVLPQVHTDELRGLLLASTPAAERARAVREGLRRAEAKLAAALPALFGGEAPAELRASLAQGALPRRRRAFDRTARLRLGVALAVAAMVIAMVALPGRRQAPPESGAAPGAAVVAPSALVRAALTRLDNPAGAGVRHERFVAATTSAGWTLERWMELEPPHRFRVEVRDDDERLRFALASDGAGLVQQRAAGAQASASSGADYQVDAAALATMLPVLRQQPDGIFMLGGWHGAYNLERFYLNQALDAPLRDLGATVAAGRPARLLAFTSEAPLPDSPEEFAERPAADPAEVLLAIDAETAALLEARVLPRADEAAGEVAVPWRAELFELLDTLPDDAFGLPPPATQGATGEELVSPRLLSMADGQATDLRFAAVPEGAPLYFPADGLSGIGYALELGRDWTVLVRETTDEVVQLIPFADGGRDFARGPRSTRLVGDRSYELIYPDNLPPGLNLSLAIVYIDPARERGMHLIYSHAYADTAEREALLAELIGSLAPLETGG